MPDEFVIPAEVQVKPGTGLDSDFYVFNVTNKKASHFFFKKKGKKAWIDTILNALDDGDLVTVDLIKGEYKTVAGKKYYRTKKVTKPA
jgi:hypothetical protein